MVKEPPRAGDVWRMNFDRTYFGYVYAAWSAKGASLNSADAGGQVRFSKDAAAARIVSSAPLLEGKLGLVVESVNPTAGKKTVTWELEAYGAEGGKRELLGKDRKTVSLEPGQTKEERLGGSEILKSSNMLTVKAVDEAGGTLLGIYERNVVVPALRLSKVPCPKIPLVTCSQIFSPSAEKLTVAIDSSLWMEKQKTSAAPKSVGERQSEKAPTSRSSPRRSRTDGQWEMSTEKACRRASTRRS